MGHQNEKGQVEFDRFAIAWIINPFGADPETMLTVDCQLFRDENPLDSHWFKPDGDGPSKDYPSIYRFNLDLKKYAAGPQSTGRPAPILYYANGRLNFWYDANKNPVLTIDLSYGLPDAVEQVSNYVLIDFGSSSSSSSSGSSEIPTSSSSSSDSSSSDSSTVASSSSSSLPSSSSGSSEGLSSSSDSSSLPGSHSPRPRRGKRERR